MARIKVRKNSFIAMISMLPIILVCWIIAAYLAITITPKLIQKYQTHPPIYYQNLSEPTRYSIPVILPTRTLVIYVFGNTHESAEENLRFFIRTAVHASHDADYYFILQRINNTYYDISKLPKLPSNGYYLQHKNRCFDLGTIGWFFAGGMVETNRYRYFIFLNASVRGPFMVSYYTNPIWFTIFTRRLNNFIRLTGSTINCEITPHVQSYLWAMELNTLQFFLDNTTVFSCHPSMSETILNGEVDASTVLLRAGYGIDSLMNKYQGVDFRYNTSGICFESNPAIDKGLGGITVDPYEVVFVKTKFNNTYYYDNQKRVLVYEKWLD